MENLAVFVKVKVIKGKGRGKKLGFPTINFAIPSELNIPFGIYAGYLYIKNVRYPAAIHFGPRPVFNEKDTSLEAYVLTEFDYIIDETQLEIVSFIRKIKKFSDPYKMKNQIKKDVEEIKSILLNKIK